MKKLLVVILILLPVVASSQKKESVVFMKTKTNSEHVFHVENADPDLVAAKQLHLQHCLDRYTTQRQWGMLLSILGGGAAIFGASESEDVLTYGGLGLSGIGIGLQMGADKWLERASIEPTRNGAVFKFKF